MKNLHLTLILIALQILFSLSFPLYAQDTNFHIYLCFGQSNMEGQGIIEAQDTMKNSRFKLMQSMDCDKLNKVTGQWYTAKPPLAWCKPRISPVDYFGRIMIENLPDSIKIGVIVVAVGACDIRLFDKDLYKDYDSKDGKVWFEKKVQNYGGNPYQRLIELAKKAQNDGVIKGILLHQGETNTGDKLWPSYVNKIYNDMITDLSLDPSETPILAGELLSEPNSCCSMMNPIINTLPETIPNAHVISSKACPGKDKAHFNAEGYRILGKRYAKTMLKLLNK